MKKESIERVKKDGLVDTTCYIPIKQMYWKTLKAKY